MSGQRQKPPDQLADRRPRRVKPLEVLPINGSAVVPALPEDLENNARDGVARLRQLLSGQGVGAR